MKRAKKIFLLFTLLWVTAENSSELQSQVNQSISYFPLKVGNVWIYNCTATGMACFCIKKYRYKIISTENLNGKTYFVFEGTSININCPWNYCSGPAILYDSLRVDSLTGNVYKYSTNGCSYSPFEILHDSLNARLGDTVRNNCGTSQYKYICMDTSSRNVLGTNRRSKSFSEVQFETGYGRSFAEGIGLTGSGYGSIACSQNSVLAGCVLDGVVFGDTSMIVGVIQISSEIPEQFSLSQNYPNPFNPNTKIRFAIPVASVHRTDIVRLAVFDILGREVSVLVNEQLKPGTYEVDFDGSNFASGIYYYTLGADPETSSGFRETKKMVLMK